MNNICNPVVYTVAYIQHIGADLRKKVGNLTQLIESKVPEPRDAKGNLKEFGI